jgi:hypothetical protein
VRAQVRGKDMALFLWVLLRVNIAVWSERKGKEDGWFVVSFMEICLSCWSSQPLLQSV